MHTDVRDEQQAHTDAGADREPEGLVARARAVHVLAVEQRRLEQEAARRRFREQSTQLLRRRLRALGVEDPEIAWDPDAGTVADVERLRFGLDDDGDLVLGRPCARCAGPMVSSPIEDLGDLGALLEREGDWPWHECPAAESPEPAEATARRAALWTLHRETALRAAMAAASYIEAAQAADHAMTTIGWDVLVEASARHQAICAALGLIPSEGAHP